MDVPSARPWLLFAVVATMLAALALKGGPQERPGMFFPNRTILVGQVVAGGSLVDFRMTNRGAVAVSCWRGGRVAQLATELGRREQRLLDVEATRGRFREIRTAPPIRSRQLLGRLHVRQGGRDRVLSDRAQDALSRVHEQLGAECAKALR